MSLRHKVDEILFFNDAAGLFGGVTGILILCLLSIAALPVTLTFVLIDKIFGLTSPNCFSDITLNYLVPAAEFVTYIFMAAAVIATLPISLLFSGMKYLYDKCYKEKKDEHFYSAVYDTSLGDKVENEAAVTPIEATTLPPTPNSHNNSYAFNLYNTTPSQPLSPSSLPPANDAEVVESSHLNRPN